MFTNPLSFQHIVSAAHAESHTVDKFILLKVFCLSLVSFSPSHTTNNIKMPRAFYIFLAVNLSIFNFFLCISLPLILLLYD